MNERKKLAWIKGIRTVEEMANSSPFQDHPVIREQLELAQQEMESEFARALLTDALDGPELPEDVG